MSTPLTDSINALTAYANETTGASDTTLSDAVGRLCDGYGGGDIISEMARGEGLLYGEDIVFDSDVETIGYYAFYTKDMASAYGNGVKLIKAFGFARSTTLVGDAGIRVGFHPDFPNLEITEQYAFAHKDFGNKAIVCNAITVGSSLCEGGRNLPSIKYTRADTIGPDQVYNASSVTQIIINSTPSSIHVNAFRKANALADIYVPWSEGEVANAPWGATNATIHYNTTFDENGDPIV